MSELNNYCGYEPHDALGTAKLYASLTESLFCIRPAVTTPLSSYKLSQPVERLYLVIGHTKLLCHFIYLFLEFPDVYRAEYFYLGQSRTFSRLTGIGNNILIYSDLHLESVSRGNKLCNAFFLRK